VIGALVLQASFAGAIERAFDERLRGALQALIASVEVLPDGSLSDRRALSESAYTQVRSGWYWQISDASGPLRRSRSLWDAELAQPVPASGKEQLANLTGPANEPLRVLTSTVEWPGRGPLRYSVAGPRSLIESELAAFRWLLSAGGAGLLFAAAGALWLQVRIGLSPLRRLGEQLQAIQTGQRERLDLPDVDELAQLADKLNRVLDRNHGMVEQGRKLAGDLAHALKTPLAVLRSELRPKPDSAIERSLTRLDDVVQRHLARASAQARSEHGRAELLPLLRQMQQMFGKLHPDCRIEIESSAALERGSSVALDADDLGEILGNLIDNGCRAARSRLRIQAQPQAFGMLLLIDDDGPGLDDQALAALGQRGRRFDESAGFGLGISIALDIAHAYGARLDFERSPLGGLSARLSLPGGP
jgi:signal transduction histidine kinase